MNIMIINSDEDLDITISNIKKISPMDSYPINIVYLFGNFKIENHK